MYVCMYVITIETRELRQDVSLRNLRCMATPQSFFAMFSKGDNFRDFLFAYLEDKDFPKGGVLLTKRICSARICFLGRIFF